MSPNSVALPGRVKADADRCSPDLASTAGSEHAPMRSVRDSASRCQKPGGARSRDGHRSRAGRREARVVAEPWHDLGPREWRGADTARVGGPFNYSEFGFFRRRVTLEPPRRTPKVGGDAMT